MTKQVQDAYIVAATRTPVGKAPKGVFRNTRPDDMLAHVLRSVVAQAPGIDVNRIDDAIIGCAMPEGEQGMNVARIGVLLAGLPDTVAAQTINRFCSSGLQTIASATQAIQSGFADVVVAGGTESMSMVPMSGFFFQPDPGMVRDDVDVYVSMGITAENVAQKYGISREDQDAFALRSHERAVEAVRSGRFDEEIVPLHVEEVTYEGGATRKTERDFVVDEGPRADTSLAALAKLKAVGGDDATHTASIEREGIKGL